MGDGLKRPELGFDRIVVGVAEQFVVDLEQVTDGLAIGVVDRDRVDDAIRNVHAKLADLVHGLERPVEYLGTVGRKAGQVDVVGHLYQVLQRPVGVVLRHSEQCRRPVFTGCGETEGRTAFDLQAVDGRSFGAGDGRQCFDVVRGSDDLERLAGLPPQCRDKQQRWDDEDDDQPGADTRVAEHGMYIGSESPRLNLVSPRI